MTWFDRKDARLLAKGGIIVGGLSALLLTAATVIGLAWRLFTVMAGIGA